MGSRGKISKFTTLKAPLTVKFDWNAIETLLGRDLSIDARSRIEDAVGFYHSQPKRKTLEEGVVPSSMLAKYSRELNKALKTLRRLPDSAQHRLCANDLKFLVWRANRVADSDPDESSNPWPFLILKLCDALGYLNQSFPKTSLSVLAENVPHQYQCLKEILTQAEIEEHFQSDESFCKAVHRAVIEFEKLFNNKE